MNIKWPEKKPDCSCDTGIIGCSCEGYNAAIDACKKAVEEAQKQEVNHCVDYLEKENEVKKIKAYTKIIAIFTVIIFIGLGWGIYYVIRNYSFEEIKDAASF